MNPLDLTFSDLTKALRKFTAEPLAADLFDWCRETKTYPHLQSALRGLNVPVDLYTPVSSLKARIERRIEVERGREARQHWSFDLNRLIAFKQMLRTIEAFGREAG